MITASDAFEFVLAVKSKLVVLASNACSEDYQILEERIDHEIGLFLMKQNVDIRYPLKPDEQQVVNQAMKTMITKVNQNFVFAGIELVREIQMSI